MNIGDSHSMGEAIRFDRTSRVMAEEKSLDRDNYLNESLSLEIANISNIGLDSSENEEKFGREQLEKSIDKINRDIEPFNKKFEYSIHEKTHQIMVKIVDKNTDEIIKEIPPEKLVDMKANMLEMVGLLVDNKA